MKKDSKLLTTEEKALFFQRCDSYWPPEFLQKAFIKDSVAHESTKTSALLTAALFHAAVPKQAVLVSYRSWHLLLIMLTSLAPSPMARVTDLLCLFTSSTTWAFCMGVTRQQMTVLHKQAKSNNTCSNCGSRAWACNMEHIHITPVKPIITFLWRQPPAEATASNSSM